MAGVTWEKFCQANAKVVKKNIIFKSQFPCCDVTVLSTNISGYKMRLPVSLSKYVAEEKGKLVLREVGGTTWDINYYKAYSKIVLSKGWVRFARENDLKLGDVCGFELLPRTSVVTLQVHIFRDSDGMTSGYDETTRQSSRTFERPANSYSADLEEFKPERPHFIKVILENNEALQKHKLLVPRRFVRIYGNGIAKYVQVKDPSGRKWRMEWSKSDGDTWIMDGWQDFAKFYSIGHGHMLIFGYEGKSQFSVVIFDKSATEIIYPVARDDIEEEDSTNVQDVKMEETDEVIETLVITPSFRKWDKSPANGEKCNEGPFFVRTDKSIGDEKKKTFERAAAFNSKNPFFSAIIQPSYIDHISATMRIPCEFFTDYIGEEEGYAKLYSNGKQCNVKFSDGRGKNNELRARKDKGKIVKPLFTIGWKKFADENSLEVGDICIFELVSITNMTFQVHIYKVNENIDPSPSTRKRKQDDMGKNRRKEAQTSRHATKRAQNN